MNSTSHQYNKKAHINSISCILFHFPTLSLSILEFERQGKRESEINNKISQTNHDSHFVAPIQSFKT